MAEYYQVFKAIHLISLISWMAGMFYLPRLFSYHAEAKIGSEMDKTFQIMEKRLLRIIINPAMVTTIIFGIILAYYYGFLSLGLWFHLKMLLVFVLVVFHVFLSIWRKDFEQGKNTKSTKFYRIMNELPTLCMILIVLLVMLKPFED